MTRFEMYLSMVDAFKTSGEVLDFLAIVSFSDLQLCQYSALLSKAFDRIKDIRGVCV